MHKYNIQLLARTWWRANHSPYLPSWSWFSDFLSCMTSYKQLTALALLKLWVAIRKKLNAAPYLGGVHSISLGHYYGKRSCQPMLRWSTHDFSLVPRLSWNANMYPRLHNFNVHVPERGSLGTRLGYHDFTCASLAPRPMTVVFGLGTRLHVHMRTTFENGVLRNKPVLWT